MEHRDALSSSDADVRAAVVERPVKSKQRVADHGEVFTPASLVEDMLDLVRDESERIDSRFLEPACGEGAFLVPVLRRKLATVRVKYRQSEQARINAALSSARTHLKAAEVTQEQLEAAISRALEKVEDRGERYETAGPRIRREMNQSIFEWIKIHDEGEIEVKLTDELAVIVHPDVKEAARQFARVNSELAVREAEAILRLAEARTNERTLAFAGQGSRNDWLVGAEGLEPPASSL
jgi:hypothetical protein